MHSACVEVKGQTAESLLSVPQELSGYKSQVLRLGGQHLYLLSRLLSSPTPAFKYTVLRATKYKCSILAIRLNLSSLSQLAEAPPNHSTLSVRKDVGIY